MKKLLFLTFTSAAALFLVLLPSAATASVVDLGAAGQFAMLALTGGIQDSGPTGPQADPYSVDGAIGVVTSGQKFQTSGSRMYNGPIYLHSGVTFNSSATVIPNPTMGPAVDSLLVQARNDAIAASNFAASLAATATYGTINNTLTISEANNGHYVFDIGSINFSGGKVLTLNGTANSTFLLNVSGSITLSPGSILLSGGLTSNNVLINYTGTQTINTSGGANSSQIFGTILAPNAMVNMTPGYVQGSIIAGSINLASGANIIPVPEVTPSSVIFGFLGLLVAFSSRRALASRLRPATIRNSR